MSDPEISPLFYFDQELTEKQPVNSDGQNSASKLNSNNGTVWFEKYRPVTFDEIVGQKEIVAKVKSKLNNLPHMILEGIAGTDKTTLVKVISNEINAKVLELNSSDNRGIETIRGTVMNFVKHSMDKNRLKIVFFDEADGMTSDAQDSLKAIIEKYSHSTRFIFACNNEKKIIDPIQSRCKTYHFKPINSDEMRTRLKHIVECENVNINNVDLDELINDSDGDFRSAINELQSY